MNTTCHSLGKRPDLLRDLGSFRATGISFLLAESAYPGPLRTLECVVVLTSS